MDSHRLITPSKITLHHADQPFSCFDWVEDMLEPIDSIRRCFSLARSLGMRTFIVEDIPADGIIQEENSELRATIADYSMASLTRISFWTENIQKLGDLARIEADALCGYMIVKRDSSTILNINRSHVFEAVFRKYPHDHNCVPGKKNYHISVNGNLFGVPGLLYAQQNGLNKVCTHVALRTLLSRRLPQGDVSYTELNRIIGTTFPGGYKFGDGLGVRQIRAILNHFHLPFRDIDYQETQKTSPDIRDTHPYQKFVYAGIESGYGALLGFSLGGPHAPVARHIIPFYGHTFNKDTWAPDADIAYFNVGGGVGYIPSESWTSSFLGHDDNFGPNLCIPRLYVKPEQADYVVELLADGVAYSGVHAEAVSLIYLYSLWTHIAGSKNRWMSRLAQATHPDTRRVVLRAVSVTTKNYLNHILKEPDWLGNCESSDVVKILENLLPARLWVVEVSLPHLFPTNERKLGEILLNPLVKYDAHTPLNYDHFLLARLPGSIFVLQDESQAPPEFIEVPSASSSHRPVLKI